jgi:hypothetical protein
MYAPSTVCGANMRRKYAPQDLVDKDVAFSNERKRKNNSITAA